MADNWFPENDVDLRNWCFSSAERLAERLRNWFLPLIDEDKPASELAHLYAVMKGGHEELKNAMKILEEGMERLSNQVVPAAFERENITTCKTSDGYRITVPQPRLFASVKADKKEEAYTWLRANELGDIITETINASTLSAVAKSLLEDGKELPEDIFGSYYKQYTSVTKVNT